LGADFDFFAAVLAFLVVLIFLLTALLDFLDLALSSPQPSSTGEVIRNPMMTLSINSFLIIFYFNFDLIIA
jgi:hypothetical protein